MGRVVVQARNDHLCRRLANAQECVNTIDCEHLLTIINLMSDHSLSFPPRITAGK